MDKLRGALKSWTIWFNGVLLTAMPFSSQMIQGVHDNLPDLSPYLPDNIFKAIGIVVVIGNMLLRAKTNSSLSDKGQR